MDEILPRLPSTYGSYLLFLPLYLYLILILCTLKSLKMQCKRHNISFIYSRTQLILVCLLYQVNVPSLGVSLQAFQYVTTDVKIEWILGCLHIIWTIRKISGSCLFTNRGRCRRMVQRGQNAPSGPPPSLDLPYSICDCDLVKSNKDSSALSVKKCVWTFSGVPRNLWVYTVEPLYNDNPEMRMCTSLPFCVS